MAEDLHEEAQEIPRVRKEPQRNRSPTVVLGGASVVDTSESFVVVLPKSDQQQYFLAILARKQLCSD